MVRHTFVTRKIARSGAGQRENLNITAIGCDVFTTRDRYRRSLYNVRGAETRTHGVAYL
jgi:hypothetical protein